MLNAARISSWAAANVPRLNNPKRFYKLIQVCNVALAIHIAWGIKYFFSLKECSSLISNQEEFGKLFTFEIASLAIWGAVLAARILAIVTGNVKNWFFLAWPEAGGSATKENKDK
eukprot:TRINITY_DN11205_c0_g1_i3.p2 TRINITY_DN11205_c0_g1~~TRINITY_DN11205_c0_g1_i3.p2  ORF type:complete len:115 (-),score=49.68 TRINITY_DN11205_c0_g1_i3:71-415(-)